MGLGCQTYRPKMYGRTQTTKRTSRFRFLEDDALIFPIIFDSKTRDSICHTSGFVLGEKERVERRWGGAGAERHAHGMPMDHGHHPVKISLPGRVGHSQISISRRVTPYSALVALC